MKQLRIQRINRTISEASEAPSILDRFSVPFHKIDTVNWTGFPYCPDVKFRIAHNGETIFLNYKVDESDIKAVCDRDNGRVWEDSCVEFFVSFDERSYYNIECNCIGKILIEKGAGRGRRTLLPGALLKLVDRWSSLGDKPIDNQSGVWEISLAIPKEIFSPEITCSFDGIKARGNFYKCGDLLKTPHYLSWNPITVEKPNFHLPEFFGELQFDHAVMQ